MRTTILLLLLLLIPVPVVAQTAAEKSSCSGSRECKPAVHFLGEESGCACFSCETGKPSEYRTCTKRQDEKNFLFEKSVQDKGMLKEQLRIR